MNAPVSPPASTPRISRLKLVLFALIPVSIVVAIAEVGATMTLERRARIESVPGSEAREYRMRIGSWPWSRRAVTPINRDGFPDREFPEVGAPKECLHVVVLGDSFILGDGVNGDSSFTSIVARELASRDGARCVRTFNLGERGSSITRQARHFRRLRERLRPDLVLLGQYQNDLGDLRDPEPRDLSVAAMDSAETAHADAARTGAAPVTMATGTLFERYRFLNPYIVRLLAYHVFAAFITNGIHRDELRHWSVIADTTRREEATRLMAQYTASFDSLASELVRDSLPFGVIIIPSKFDVMAGRFPEEEFFLGVAGKHALPTLRLFPLLDEKRTPYAFLTYDGHLNEHGNRLVAGAVTDWLLRAEPAPFAVLRAPVDR